MRGQIQVFFIDCRREYSPARASCPEPWRRTPSTNQISFVAGLLYGFGRDVGTHLGADVIYEHEADEDEAQVAIESVKDVDEDFVGQEHGRNHSDTPPITVSIL